MKKLAACAAVCVVGVGAAFLASRLGAQNTESPFPPTRVAAVNLRHLFENYEKRQALEQDLQAEVERRENQERAMQAEIQRLREEMNRFDPDTPEHRQREQQLTQRLAELQAYHAQAERELQRQGSQMLHTVYNDIVEEIHRYASHPSIGLDLVVRIDQPTASESNLREVMVAVDRQVLFHQPSLDITQPILDMLNQRYARERAAGGGQGVVPAGNRPQ